MLDYFTWKRSNVAPSSYPNYERWVKKFIKFHGDTSTVTLEDIARFKSHLEAYGYSPKNVQYGLSIVRDYLHYQVEVHGLSFPLKLFRIKNERSDSHHPITREEFSHMLGKVPAYTEQNIQRRLMILMLWDTGMRGGELLRLRVSDIQDLKYAYIDNEKNYKRRLVAWNDETAHVLSMYLAIRSEILSAEDWLFIPLKRERKDKISMRNLQLIIKELSEGLEATISPHSFRHGFVHRMLDEGKPITTVAQMLGHSTSLNVMTYSQRSGPEMREAWGIR